MIWNWKDYKVYWPEGESLGCKVERFEIDGDGAALYNLGMMWQPGMGRRMVTAGTYTKLSVRGTMMMSDTQAEINDLIEPITRATGRCLVNGLGLGVVVRGMLLKDEVSVVTVVEKEQGVIDLVGVPLLEQFGRRLDLVKADALTFQPGTLRYNVVWHDIWPDICVDNLPEYHKLHRRYGRRTDWQGSWCRGLVEMYR